MEALIYTGFILIIVFLIFYISNKINLWRANSYRSSNGFIDYLISDKDGVVMRIYNPNVYWNAHNTLNQEAIIEEGTFQIDGFGWILYNVKMTKEEYINLTIKRSEYCGCGACKETVKRLKDE